MLEATSNDKNYGNEWKLSDGNDSPKSCKVTDLSSAVSTCQQATKALKDDCGFSLIGKWQIPESSDNKQKA